MFSRWNTRCLNSRQTSKNYPYNMKIVSGCAALRKKCLSSCSHFLLDGIKVDPLLPGTKKKKSIHVVSTHAMIASSNIYGRLCCCFGVSRFLPRAVPFFFWKKNRKQKLLTAWRLWLGASVSRGSCLPPCQSKYWRKKPFYTWLRQ